MQDGTSVCGFPHVVTDHWQFPRVLVLFVCFWKDTGLRSFYDNTTPAIFTTFVGFCISPKAIVGKITIP